MAGLIDGKLIQKYFSSEIKIIFQNLREKEKKGSDLSKGQNPGGDSKRINIHHGKAFGTSAKDQRHGTLKIVRIGNTCEGLRRTVY